MEGPAPGEDAGSAEEEGTGEECTEEARLGAREEDRNGTSARDDEPA